MQVLGEGADIWSRNASIWGTLPHINKSWTGGCLAHSTPRPHPESRPHRQAGERQNETASGNLVSLGKPTHKHPPLKQGRQWGNTSHRRHNQKQTWGKVFGRKTDRAIIFSERERKKMISHREAETKWCLKCQLKSRKPLSEAKGS